MTETLCLCAFIAECLMRWFSGVAGQRSLAARRRDAVLGDEPRKATCVEQSRAPRCVSNFCVWCLGCHSRS